MNIAETGSSMEDKKALAVAQKEAVENLNTIAGGAESRCNLSYLMDNPDMEAWHDMSDVVDAINAVGKAGFRLNLAKAIVAGLGCDIELASGERLEIESTPLFIR